MEEKNPIQVADRLFGALELLAAEKSLGLLEISKTLELNKSTAHRIMSSLQYMGYVAQDPDTQKYHLTYKIVSLSSQITGQIDILDSAHGELRKLMKETGETVHLVEREGIHAVYIDKVAATRNTVQMVSRIGNRIPLYCSGVGKAIMATLDNEEIQKLWNQSDVRPLTACTITDYNTLMTVLDEVRSNGYALDNEENEIGVRCIAACIPEPDGPSRFALSISAPIARMDNDRVKELAPLIQRTAQMIADRL